MDLSAITASLDSFVTPVIRTDFSDGDAWSAVRAAIGPAASSEHETSTDQTEAADKLSATANIDIHDDPQYAGLTPSNLAQTVSADTNGYAILIDAQSMAEVRSGEDVTVVFVDLMADTLIEFEEDSFRGNTFRATIEHVNEIEPNLIEANISFADFVEELDYTGTFRGWQD